ncbi:acetolactate synthase large subunit [Micromonospora sp. BRA006-A]|uniref:acetolactate synthase large subunit n=1 Tax=Micromonospora sp. BRA006-A TaxID=2962860 RepID=UPI00296E84E8|nr:acetolactate synthase large subunit [Micromonospora sp. BRA006-A]MDW3846966.1 acetolactate synthase large subunit [Micromonospora sp. BRA006-A]
MNGAEALMRTLVDGGVEVVFTNPGTTELHLVGALDSVPQLRGVLALFEGVVTGAADGYARIAGKPAATLLHLGPGFAYGLTNLHNSRRANSPVVNIVGDHPTYHNAVDPPLASDIAALGGWLRGPVRRPENPAGAGTDAAAALADAVEPPGQIATVIMPADVSWSDGAAVGVPAAAQPAPAVAADVINQVAQLIRGGDTAALVIGGPALREAGLCAASRIAAATGVRVLQELYSNRVEHGAGLPTFPRLGFYPDQALEQLAGVHHVITAGAKAPVAFFAYSDKPSCLVPPDATTHVLAEVGQDAEAALTQLADLVAPETTARVTEPRRPQLPTGPLTLQSWCDVVAALLPERAIVIDESVSSGTALAHATAGAPRHDVLMQTGGAMGDGMPLAVGAAVAAPDRPVVALIADGCAMYTPTALWTQAREQLNVTTVILDNHSYAILRQEWNYYSRRPGTGDPDTNPQFDLTNPAIDFVRLAESFGVPATRATTAEELTEQLANALAEPGPHLIQAVIPPAA